MKDIYASKHYKKLLLIPAVLLVVCLFFLPSLKLGTDLKGGILITAPIEKDVDAHGLEAKLNEKFSLEDLTVRTTSGSTKGIYIQLAGEKDLLIAEKMLNQKQYADVITISQKFTGVLNVSGEEATQADEYFSRAREAFKNSFVAFLSTETGTGQKDFSVGDVGPSLGAFFLSQAQNAVIFAFVFICGLVFFFFRNPLISFAVIQSAFYDTFLGLSAMAIFSIPLSMATIAPLLMLIGYSVDTDIMLTDRVLKRKEGSPVARTNAAIKTGLTMTLTTMSALICLFLVSSASNMILLSEISLILIIGLVGDIIATWCTNAPLVLWFVERRDKKQASVTA